MVPKRSPDPRPRRSPALLAAGALALAALLWAGRAELPEHLARWADDGRAHATVDFAGLSADLDAAALARLLGGLPLQCRPAADGSVCDAALAQANGVPAARLRATWQHTNQPAPRQARLKAVELQLPWWAHGQAAGMLSARLGPPSSQERTTADGRRQAILGWNLPQGTVQLARPPGWNPLHWSVLYWHAAGVPTP